MRHLALAVLATIGSLAGTAHATTFALSYAGYASYTPEHSPYLVTYDDTGSGIMSFDATKSSITLSDGLTGFSFNTKLLETLQSASDTYYRRFSITYTMSDLDYFEASVSNGVITSFSFSVSKNQSYGDSTSTQFVAEYEPGNGFAYTSMTYGADIQGSIDVAPSAALEPASWALMVGGFGAIGRAMRTRQRKAVVSFG